MASSDPIVPELGASGGGKKLEQIIEKDIKSIRTPPE